MARLDRFYIGECLANKGGSLGIMSASAFSNHFLVIINLFGPKKRSQQKVRIPTTMFMGRRGVLNMVNFPRHTERIYSFFIAVDRGIEYFFQEIAIKDKLKFKEKEIAL